MKKKVTENCRSAFCFLLLTFFVTPLWAEDDTSTQLWGSFVFGHLTNEKLYFEVELQPKVQVAGGEKWRNLDATWYVEYYPNRWLDLTGELVTGFTDQNDDVSSFELTPKVGIRLHLIEEMFKTIRKDKVYLERITLNRLFLALWLRLENRHFYYFGEMDSSHDVRFRARPEVKFAINNSSLGHDKTLFLHTDVEFFFPVDSDIPERFDNKIRTRLGFGYRFNANRKVEILYVHDENRESPLDGFENEANCLDFRFTFLF